MIQNVEQAIRDYLPEIIHLSLATCADNRPWVCELHYSYDQDLNLYFRSLASRRHSLEIAKNPHVAGTIVTQHVAGQKPRGVYFEGLAELLTGVDTDHPAYQTYSERFGAGPKIIDEAKTDTGHKFYKINVSKFYLFDTVESNPSQKYELAWHAS